MITDDQARGIALFFLFSLMDEKTALAAAHKAIAAAKAVAPRSGDAPTEAAVVAVLRKTFDHHRRNLPRSRVHEAPTCWRMASDIDPDAWERFHKDSSDAEIVAVTLAKVLGFGEAAITEGLGVSLGTLRYRVAKGMRQLGAALGRAPMARA